MEVWACFHKAIETLSTEKQPLYSLLAVISQDTLRGGLEILDRSGIVCIRTQISNRCFYKVEGSKGYTYHIFEELASCPCVEFCKHILAGYIGKALDLIKTVEIEDCMFSMYYGDTGN